eukprot:Hpha_TRINITY_DN18715_c0_g1::TRINITY_DN18715_c0_g1_i1::g.47387::m.47387/K18932/ZDHHC; palmitoyltransferase
MARRTVLISREVGNMLFGLFGVVCVGFAVLVIVGTIFTYFHTVYPLLMSFMGIPATINFAGAVWLSFNLVFNYVMVVNTRPGLPNRSVMTAQEIDVIEKAQADGKKTKWCQRCDDIKPLRAHHCSVCRRCVLRMDHHCPWVNGCVGHWNLRYFLLFLVYLWLSVLYAVCTIGLHWLGVLINTDVAPDVMRDSKASVQMCFVICLALLVAIGFMLTWSGHLALTNQTTIEYLGNRDADRRARHRGRVFKNPFDFGWRKNLREIFGPFDGWLELLLPSMTPVDLDGHHWQVHEDLEILSESDLEDVI